MALTPRPPEAPRKGPQCTLCKALDGMDDTDQAILTGWVEDRRNRPETVVKWLAEDGVPGVSPTAVGRHRNRQCLGTRHAE